MLRSAVVALTLCCAAPAAVAATCSVDLEGNDAMRFDKSSIEVSRSCRTFTINLKHTGQLAQAVMGHNVVITTESDFPAVDAQGRQAGLENAYVKPGDARVVAHSPVIGGGETTSVRFSPSRLGNDSYVFFCSFPGHSALMKGTVTLVP